MVKRKNVFDGCVQSAAIGSVKIRVICKRIVEYTVRNFNTRRNRTLRADTPLYIYTQLHVTQL